VWSALAKMYASRNSHYECTLVLEACIAGTAHTALASSRDVQAVYDSTVKVLCSSMQFRKAISVHQQSRDTPGLATSELKHLSYLLRYMSELETVDDKVLRLTSGAARAVLRRRVGIDDARGTAGACSLSQAVVTLLCKHGRAELAAEFLEDSGPVQDDAYSRLHSFTAVIRSLTRSGHLERALSMFGEMVKQHPTDTSNAAVELGSVWAATDAAYHDLCQALRQDPSRLARFASSYRKRLPT